MNFYHFLVLRIEFSSTTYNGSESAGEILVGISVSGGTAITSIDVLVYLNEVTATGEMLYWWNENIMANSLCKIVLLML